MHIEICTMFIIWHFGTYLGAGESRDQRHVIILKLNYIYIPRCETKLLTCTHLYICLKPFIRFCICHIANMCLTFCSNSFIIRFVDEQFAMPISKFVISDLYLRVLKDKHIYNNAAIFSCHTATTKTAIIGPVL
jgi:hypothetical protein